MKLKSAFTFLTICLTTILQAQTSINALFSYPEGSNYYCGGRVIIGQIYIYNSFGNPSQKIQPIIYSEDNKFYLEIATENSKNYTKILAQKIDIGGSGNVQFRLPDSLKIGQTYLFKMSSTNPVISTQPYLIKFGAGMLPFIIDFKQELSFNKVAPLTDLSYMIRLKNKADSAKFYFNNNLDFKLKLSDGTNYIINPYQLPYNSILSVVPKDSLNIYKIDEIVNSCGVKGEVLGEARVIRKDFVDGIFIKNEHYTCFGNQFTIDVSSKSINPKTTFIVEFSKDEKFKSIVSTITSTLNNKNQLIIDLTKTLKESNNYNFRVICESPNLVSNVSFIYTYPQTQIVTPIIENFNDKELTIYLGQQNLNNPNSSAFMQLNELVINGIDIAKPEGFASPVLKVPMPKKDSTLVFSKISNSCGSLIIKKPELIIKPANYAFIYFKTSVTSICEGGTIDYTFDIPPNIKVSDFNLSFNFIVTLEFLNSNQPLTGNNYAYYLDLNAPYKLNIERKTVSITIPKNIAELLGTYTGNRKIVIKEIQLAPYFGSKIINQIVRYNFISPTINLLPKLTLINPAIESKGVAFVDVPVKFIGGDYINYTLSNGQTEIIDHKNLNCRNCQNLNGGEQTIKIFADKTTTFKLTSAKNECGIGTVSGETTINVIAENPSLVFDETKVPTNICRGSTLEIPFQQYGKWATTPAFKGYIKITDNEGKSISTQFDISKSPFLAKVSNNKFDKQMEVWVEAVGTTIKTEVKKITLESLPNNLYFSSNNAISEYKNKIETVHLEINSQFISYTISGYGGNLEFSINGKTIKNNYTANFLTQYQSSLKFEKDTLITFKSASNTCGTTDINRQIRLLKVPTVISGYDQTNKYFLLESECAGSKRVITYEYQGVIPKKDSLIVQLAKYKNFDSIDPFTLKFFDVPTTQGKTELTMTFPDTCLGYYVYRIRSVTNNYFSSYRLDYRNIKQKPYVKITTQNGKLETLGLPGANLYLNSNFDKSSFFKIILNDGTIHSSNDFGVNFDYIFDKGGNLEKSIVKSDGKYFSPLQTTTYSIKSVYNQCGYGTAEGSAKIIVQPTIINKISNQNFSNTFCDGDSISIDLSYIGEFPKDTLMGIYLHNFSKASYNEELITFKNNPNKVNLKLPKEINSGNYFIQTRKRSRSKVYFAENQKPDSLAKVNAILNLDAEKHYLNIATIPNVSLSGSTEIFVGNSAVLITKLLNQESQDIAVTNDTVSFINGMPYFYNFSDGNKYTAIDKNIVVTPKKTEIYSITSIKNACGVGKSTGTAQVVVIPKSEKRIETIGYLRKYSSSYRNIYYEPNNTFCAGIKDSLDVKVFGIDSKTDFSKYKVVFSNKDGMNYSPLKTTKIALVEDLPAYKTVRLWHEFPENTAKGSNYRIKGISDDETILSTPMLNPIEILELPTASLTGNSSFLTGEKVNATIKLTGDAPWTMSVVDKDNKFVYNTMPTKKDTLEEYKNFKPQLIYTNEFKLELAPEKANTYKVSKVFNANCGYGKVIAGEFSVELILANENPSRSLIQIYPNPTAENLNIDLTSLSEITNIGIFDINGRTISNYIYDKTQIQQKQSLNFSQYSSGIYLIKISSGKFLQTYRVVKQ